MQAVTNHKARNSGSVVIVVDDDAAVRNSLKFSLELEGFAVRVFAAGRDLLSDNEVADCACLVIDQNMPGLTGLETVRELRQRRVSIPTILITGRPSRLLSANATRVGAEIIEKPLLGNALLDGIRAAIKH